MCGNTMTAFETNISTADDSKISNLIHISSSWRESRICLDDYSADIL